MTDLSILLWNVYDKCGDNTAAIRWKPLLGINMQNEEQVCGLNVV